jgi:uncharacterized alpha-E superfamily protein
MSSWATSRLPIGTTASSYLAARALKIWLTLRYFGTRRIAEAISPDNSMAEYLASDSQLPPTLSYCPVCIEHHLFSLRTKGTARATQRASPARKRQLQSELDR